MKSSVKEKHMCAAAAVSALVLAVCLLLLFLSLAPRGQRSGACISGLRAKLLKSPSLRAGHADVATVLRDWELRPAPASEISRADLASKQIYLVLRDATGQLFDADTLLLALTHELTHAALAADDHGPLFQRKMSDCVAALQRDGLLSPGAEPHPLYPAALLDDSGEERALTLLRNFAEAAHLGG